MQTEHFQSGMSIFTEGQPGKKMYIVKEGELELSVRGKVIVKVQKGGIIGEMALIDSKHRSATAVAMTDCHLAPIDEKRFLELVQTKPGFSLEVMRVLVERLRLMDEKA